MALIGDNEETKFIALPMLSELLSMHEDSREDIRRFQGLDRRRNGTELMSTKLMESGRKLPESGHPVFRATSAQERGELKQR